MLAGFYSLAGGLCISTYPIVSINMCEGLSHTAMLLRPNSGADGFHTMMMQYVKCSSHALIHASAFVSCTAHMCKRARSTSREHGAQTHSHRHICASTHARQSREHSASANVHPGAFTARANAQGRTSTHAAKSMQALKHIIVSVCILLYKLNPRATQVAELQRSF